jgi:hypothetical protein
MPGRAEKAVADVVTENASDGKMNKVSQTEIIKPRRRSEWTIPVYHTVCPECYGNMGGEKKNSQNNVFQEMKEGLS